MIDHFLADNPLGLQVEMLEHTVIDWNCLNLDAWSVALVEVAWHRLGIPTAALLRVAYR